jgi:hypothetical protein
MQRAYALGDHHAARALARQALSANEADAQAARILAHTEPDPFITWVALAGLGLTAWLVYNYAL